MGSRRKAHVSLIAEPRPQLTNILASVSKPAHAWAWKALAGIMMTNGSLALVAPRWLAERIGVSPEAQPATLYVLRMFGIRTVLVAADLWLEPDRRQRALREGVVMHSVDAAAALIAAAFGHLPVRSGLTAAGISTANTALCVIGSRRR